MPLRRLLPFLALAGGALLLVPSALDPAAVPARRDLLDFFLPMKAVAARELAAGRLPAWDPWTLGGHPFLANLQSQLLYPPNWLVVPLGAAWGLSVLTALHLFVGGLGARSVALRLGRSDAAALLAGFGHAFGGFVTSLTDLHNQLCTAAWTPWIVAAGLAVARTASRRSIAALAATCALAFLAGAPQLAALSVMLGLATCAAAWLARRRSGGRRSAATPDGPRRPSSGRVVRALGGAGLLAVLAVAAQLGPFAGLVLDSDRVEDGVAEGGRHALEPHRLAAVVDAPDGPFDAPAGPYVRSLYVGAPLLFLASAGLLRRDVLHRIFGLAALSSLVLAASPSIPLLGEAVLAATPFLRYPMKYALLFALVVPLLAASGLDLALAASRRPGRRPRPRLLAILAWTTTALVGADLVLAHRTGWLALPADRLLAPTPAITLLAAQTGPDGPRVVAPPLSRDRLSLRAERVAAGDFAGAMRERVELLEGGLPALFAVHATWGGAALTWRPRALAAERLAEAPTPEALDEARVGFVLIDSLRPPVPFPLVPVEGGTARLHVVPSPVHDRHAGARRWLDTDRAVGPPGLPAPAPHDGWREGPAGTWSFRPSGWPALAVLSTLAWLVIAALCLPWRRRDVGRAAVRR